MAEMNRGIIGSFVDFALQKGWIDKENILESLDCHLAKLENEIKTLKLQTPTDRVRDRKKRRSVCQPREISLSSSSSDDEIVLQETEDSPECEEADEIIESIDSLEERPAAEIVNSSSEEDDFDLFINRMKTPKKKVILSSDEEEGLSDFIVDDNVKEIKVTRDEQQWKTPRKPQSNFSFDQEDVSNDSDVPLSTAVKKTTRNNKMEDYAFKTPMHLNRKPYTPSILDKISTPKTPAGPRSAAYKKEYKKLRDTTAQELFVLFNETVFDKKLPEDLKLKFNSRMTSTAGFCYYYTNPLTDVKTARIELAEKICDSVERLRDTVIHELCHAAAWIINGVKCGHGKVWKSWANKAHKAHPDLPPISRCHQFDVECRFNYQCLDPWCNRTFGRHSKSLKQCPSCYGPLQLLGRDGVTPLKQRNPSKFAMFVKDEFATTKSSNPGKSHSDIMKILSQKFSSLKT